MDYREAGVDIEAGRAFVDRIEEVVRETYRPGVLGGLGGFGGCFEIPAGYRQPVLVSGTDGVGTKLKLAHQLDRHDTVGIDLVAMCANDVLTSGAEPLYFLDYLATGKLNGEQLAQVVTGIATGCRQAGCALLGGETAEMPGFYQPGEYDIAGFCVGIVEKSQLLDGSQVKVGDVAIALPSSGVHSNGYSLVRKIVGDGGYGWTDCPEAFGGRSLGEVFLTPTYIYVKPVLSLREADIEIRAMAHITGGGLPENLPRCLGENRAIAIDRAAWDIPPVFRWLAEAGNVQQSDMFDTFNMGVGFVVVVSPDGVDRTLETLKTQNLDPFVLGEVVSGNGEVLGLS
ncbi:Phosphoribosylformylglycinamidine cyclo-ligase [Geitlerinema sp. FC II]|nr:phosphoribosylformylglycinamidine cyclo-ligase [Geitlerinema sp. CS-897]PPT10389.1 Phosphoribosylformylglycinamidine cyclo-ligase [Geitlerinema sp. FC II]